MQKLATNQSVAAANKAIQDNSAGGGQEVLGEPMAPHDVTYVRSVFEMLLTATSGDGSNPAMVKKRNETAARLEDLFNKLQQGTMKTAVSQKVLQMVKAVEAQDYAGAKKLHQELSGCDWDKNKYWLMGVQR